jgi:hypothetical protein
LVLDESFGEYRIKIYRNDYDGWLDRVHQSSPGWLAGSIDWVRPDRPSGSYEILRNGRRVYSAEGSEFRLVDVTLPMVGGTTNVSILGRDINGDGVPDLAIEDPHGRLGGQTVHLFECGQQFRLTCMVESLEPPGPVFRDYDGDGAAEVLLSDDAFYHWPVCMDGEPMPEVILRWRNGKYVAARDLMYKPAPSKEELEATATAICASPEWDAESGWVPPQLWTNAIALMYSGHERLGLEFVDRAWQPGFPGKDELSRKKQLIDYYLRSRLDDSVYWPDLKLQSSTNRLD